MSHGLPRGNVFSGARARLSVDGKIIGYATNCAGSETIQYEAVNVLDHLHVQEHVPVGYDVTFTASRVRLIGRQPVGPNTDFSNSLRGTLDLFPKIGVDDAEHLLNILNRAEMAAQIEDSVTGKIFMLLEQVKIQSHNWTVASRGIVGEDITFVAVRMRDEAEA